MAATSRRRSWTPIASSRFLDRLVLASSVILLVASVVIYSGPAHQDARAYWGAWPDPYSGSVVGGESAYVYSPAFAQAIWPLTLLPLTVFAVIWTILHAVALVYLVGWRLAGFVAILFFPAADDMAIGNIHLFMAVAIAAGYRWGAAWSFLILTKVTPALGLVWFAVRGEWRLAREAGLATLAIVVVSVVLAPDLWRQWLEVLGRSVEIADPGIVISTAPLAYRLPIAFGVIVIGAWRTWRWAIPLAAIIALPAMWFSSGSLMLSEVRDRADKVVYLVKVSVAMLAIAWVL